MPDRQARAFGQPPSFQRMAMQLSSGSQPSPASSQFDDASSKATIDQVSVHARERCNVRDTNIFIIGMKLFDVARTEHDRFDSLSAKKASIQREVAVPRARGAQAGIVECCEKVSVQ